MHSATPDPGAGIAIEGVPNLRDLGGWSVSGGEVKRGMMFRSAEWSGLQGDAAANFAALGIRSVYDLRTEDERTASPNVVPEGTEYVVVDVLSDATNAGPAQVSQALADPKLAEEMLGGGKAEAMFQQGYRQIVGLPSALTGYRKFFTDIADTEHRPGLFHCSTGKDRTGWAAASLLLLLGASQDDVYKDYMLTNDQLLPQLEPMIDQFVGAGGDRDLITLILGVRASYLDAALDEMSQRFGTIENYFSNGLALGDDTIEQLRLSYVDTEASAG